MKNNDSFKEVEKTLSSLDEVTRAEVDIDFEKTLGQKISFLSSSHSTKWLKLNLAAMIVMALVNGYVYWEFTNTVQQEQTEVIELLADDLLYQSMEY